MYSETDWRVCVLGRNPIYLFIKYNVVSMYIILFTVEKLAFNKAYVKLLGLKL